MDSSNLNFEFRPAPAIEDEVTADRLNAMLRAVRQAQPPARMKGARITITDEGWTLALDPGAGGAGADLHPWKVTGVGSAEAEDGWQITMLPGTVSGLLPDNILYPIDWDGSDDDRFVVATCQMADDGIQSAEVSVQNEAPGGYPITKGTLESEVVILVGVLRNRQPYAVCYRNVTLEPILAFETDKESLEVGEYPLDKWWTWRLGGLD